MVGYLCNFPFLGVALWGSGVVLCEMGAASFYFCSDKSSFNPRRIASALVILCLSQYAVKALFMSSSKRTLMLTFLGLSFFGRPVRGLRVLTSLSALHKLILLFALLKVN